MKIHIPLEVENFFHLPCCRPKSSWEETELLSSMLSSRYSSSLVLRADRLLLWESIKLHWRKRTSLPEYRRKWQWTHKTYSAFQIQQHTNLATKLHFNFEKYSILRTGTHSALWLHLFSNKIQATHSWEALQLLGITMASTYPLAEVALTLKKLN